MGQIISTVICVGFAAAGGILAVLAAVKSAENKTRVPALLLALCAAAGIIALLCGGGVPSGAEFTLPALCFCAAIGGIALFFGTARTDKSVIIKPAKRGADNNEELLYVVNDVAALLIGSEVGSFDTTLFRCMEKVGVCVDVDRVYIWNNHMVGDELYCTQIYEWSGGAEPQQGNELTDAVPFPGAWYPNLSVNRCINGRVQDFPDYEREHLRAQGIVSILVVPVFLHNEFWGFVGFDDCHSERIFTQAEEAILRSVSLLFATSFLRNDMTVKLMQAREEALSSAKAKTDFLANMSHEIRTPINAITGMASIARMTDDRVKIKDCLDRIDTASRQLLALINDVLDMSKIEAGKLEIAHEPFDLSAMLSNIQSMIAVRAGEKNQTFEMETDPGLPQVIVGDDVRISQVLLNLLSNAVKFTPEGGKIRLTAQKTGETGDGRDRLEFSVTDNGIGIRPEEMDRLFTKFEQADRGTSRQFGGTGLGLAICKSIADLLGGGIGVESEPGRGSKFTVWFPAERGSNALMRPIREEPEQEMPDFSGRRALLAEDIEINREIVLALLEDTGLEIDQAQDGQIAVEMFRAQPERYDIIFMDIHMPVMDGYSATETIRETEHPRAKQVPILAMTANAFSEDVQHCLKAGMNDHIAKPIDIAELMHKISVLLGLAG